MDVMNQYFSFLDAILLLLRCNTSPSSTRRKHVSLYFRYFLNTCSLFSRVIYFRVLNFSGCKKSAKISENKILAKITGYTVFALVSLIQLHENSEFKCRYYTRVEVSIGFIDQATQLRGL